VVACLRFRFVRLSRGLAPAIRLPRSAYSTRFLREAIEMTSDPVLRRRGPGATPPTTAFSVPGFAGCTLLPSSTNAFVSVFAEWTCPTLGLPSQGLSSGCADPILGSWIGIDGALGPNEVLLSNLEMLQAGFFSKLNLSVSPPVTMTSGPWWMWFPPSNNPSVSSAPISNAIANFPVATGDVVMIAMMYFTGKLSNVIPPFSLPLPYAIMCFYNATQGYATSTVQTAPAGAQCPGACVEFVLEYVNISNPGAFIGPTPGVPSFSDIIFDPFGGDVTEPPIPSALSTVVLIEMIDQTLPGSPVAGAVSTDMPNSVEISFE